MIGPFRSRFARPFTPFVVCLLLTADSAIAQRTPARPAHAQEEKDKQEKKERDRTRGVVHSLNGAEGDVKLQGEGGLVVSTAGDTITVSAPATLGIGRSEPDPQYALDVGGTGVVRIGNSIYLDGVNNTIGTSTKTLSLTDSSLTTTGTVSATTITAASFSGSGAGLTNISFGQILGGANPQVFVAPNPSNQFGGVFTGTFVGNGAGLTGITTSGLAAGTYSNLYSFTNAANQFSGLFAGTHTGTFDGAFTGNLSGNATSATSATTATTATIANNLAGGTFGNVYQFTNAANTFNGTFTGNGAGLTGVTTSGLATGTYGNQYAFTNPLNTYAGTFTGNGAGLTNVDAATAQSAQTAQTADTASVATTLAPGTHTATYQLTNGANQFSGVFSGDGSGLTGVQTTGLAAGEYSGQYTFGNANNSFSGVFTGDGSGLTNLPASGWSLEGNAGITPSQFIGTTDQSTLQFRVDNATALRIEQHYPAADPSGSGVPNIVAGGAANQLGGNNIGVVIAGGGSADWSLGGANGAVIGVDFAVVAGGQNNIVANDYAVVSGGQDNSAEGDWSIVAGGVQNRTAGSLAVVLGGYDNRSTGDFAVVAGGSQNRAQGLASFVGGGANNVAQGNVSVAFGQNAKAVGQSSFVFADGSAPEFLSADHEFAVLASGGVRFVTDHLTNTGVQLVGGTWTSLSDRNAKKNLEAVNGEEVLRAVATLPVWRWSYLNQPDGIRHMGPTAQDFRAAFSLGVDDTSITVVDADGVNLAAIQALEKRTAKLQEENADLRRELQTLRSTQEQMLQQLEQLLRQR
jgi:hypothetical protein